MDLCVARVLFSCACGWQPNRCAGEQAPSGLISHVKLREALMSCHRREGCIFSSRPTLLEASIASGQIRAALYKLRGLKDRKALDKVLQKATKLSLQASVRHHTGLNSMRPHCCDKTKHGCRPLFCSSRALSHCWWLWGLVQRLQHLQQQQHWCQQQQHWCQHWCQPADQWQWMEKGGQYCHQLATVTAARAPGGRRRPQLRRFSKLACEHHRHMYCVWL